KMTPPTLYFSIAGFGWPGEIPPEMATASEVSADLIYELPSIVERLNPAELFPKSQPLEIELGCGDASFLVEYARRYPERNFIGIERLLGRLRKLDRKGR